VEETFSKISESKDQELEIEKFLSEFNSEIDEEVEQELLKLELENEEEIKLPVKERIPFDFNINSDEKVTSPSIREEVKHLEFA